MLSVVFLRHSLLPLEERSVLVVYFEMLWFLLGESHCTVHHKGLASCALTG